MSIEMITTKLISPYFGQSINVWGSVLSVFMLSLALGAMSGGWLSRKAPQPHILIYMLAGLVASLIYIIQIETMILDFILTLSVSMNLKVLAACIVLFTPFSFVSGMIAPYSIQLLSQTHQASGMTAGMLYFLSTIASSLGAVFTSFYLVVLFSVETIFILNIALVLSLVCVYVAFNFLEDTN